MFRCPDCKKWFDEFKTILHSKARGEDRLFASEWGCFCPKCDLFAGTLEDTSSDFVEGQPCEECDEPAVLNSHLCASLDCLAKQEGGA